MTSAEWVELPLANPSGAGPELRALDEQVRAMLMAPAEGETLADLLHVWVVRIDAFVPAELGRPVGVMLTAGWSRAPGGHDAYEQFLLSALKSVPGVEATRDGRSALRAALGRVEAGTDAGTDTEPTWAFVATSRNRVVGGARDTWTTALVTLPRGLTDDARLTERLLEQARVQVAQTLSMPGLPVMSQAQAQVLADQAARERAARERMPVAAYQPSPPVQPGVVGQPYLPPAQPSAPRRTGPAASWVKGSLVGVALGLSLTGLVVTGVSQGWWEPDGGVPLTVWGLSLLLGPLFLLVSIVVRLAGRASLPARWNARWMAALGWGGVVSFVLSSWYAVYNGETLF